MRSWRDRMVEDDAGEAQNSDSSVLELSSSLLASGKIEAALELAQTALEMDDKWAAMHLMKGHALMALEPSRCAGGSCRQHAAAAFAEGERLATSLTERLEARERLIEATTDIRGIDGTSAARVAALFDEYADTFEEHLVQDLAYSAPPIVAEAAAMVEKRRGQKLERVLDLGCGTGLIGRELRKAGITASLEGVDLSSKMVARASQFYDLVAVCDARRLQACGLPKGQDLAVLGDVLVYLDDADSMQVLRQLRTLEVNLVALTLERPSLETETMLNSAGRPWRTVLGATGRYAHNLNWLVRFMQIDLDFELQWIAELCETCPYPPLRYERASPVRGAVVVFQNRVAT